MRISSLTRRRSTALLSAAVVAASGIVATMGASNAAVTLGPDRASDGLPAYVVDAQGVAIAPCDTGTGVCGGVFDPTDPAYWDAGGDAGPIRLTYSVSSPAGGRIARFTGSELAPGKYTIKDPWGTVTCTAPGGKMDCRLPGGRITTLLRNTSAPAGFVGNPNLNRTFTGSPTGFNRVLITGPGAFKASTNRLAISGMLRDSTAMSSINTMALTLGNGRKTTAVTRTVRYSSFGTAAARPTVRKGGTNPGAFSVRDTCTSQAPGSTCSITVKFVPRQNAGVKRASLVIDDNSMAAPRRVSLKGLGTR
jgi:hypothetical protein